MLLPIQNLKVTVDSKSVLNNFTLSLEQGQIYVLLGPNGAGKSSLAYTLAGHPKYQIVAGEAEFNTENLLLLKPDERAKRGLHIAFQQPVEIAGLTTASFLKTAYNEKLKFQGLQPLDSLEFLDLLEEKAKLIKLAPEYLRRGFNQGFSGGEKKRMEMLQLVLFEPELAILDEIDSGLDLEGKQILFEVVDYLHNLGKSVLIISHQFDTINQINFHQAFVLQQGTITAQGDKELVKQVEKQGFPSF